MTGEKCGMLQAIQLIRDIRRRFNGRTWINRVDGVDGCGDNITVVIIPRLLQRRDRLFRLRSNLAECIGRQAAHERVGIL